MSSDSTPGAAPIVIRLGIGQMVAWASSYFLLAILAVPMARDLGTRPAVAYGAFSFALIVSGLLGPAAGRLIDRRGGRQMLMTSNIGFAIGLAALAAAQDTVMLFAAWTLLGLAMSAGLYEAAFATLVAHYGQAARRPMTGATLISGFTSTIGWPITTLLEDHLGWRGACLSWAMLHLVIALPLHAGMPLRAGRPLHAGLPPHGGPQNSRGAPSTPPADTTASADPHPHPPPTRPRLTAFLLSYSFAVTFFLATTMASHLPRLLQAVGCTLAVGVAVGALIGPAQVGVRLLELSVLRRLDPLRLAQAAAFAYPIGAAAVLVLGSSAAPVFALLYGAGNGILAVARGTLPLVLFGAQGYGARQGVLTMPAKMAQAGAPLAVGLALDHWGAATLWLLIGLASSNWIALMLLPRLAARTRVS